MADANVGGRKYSSILLLIIMVILALSVITLLNAIELYGQGLANEGNYFLLISVIGFGIASYVVLQSRRRIPNVMIDLPKVSTTLTCDNCGFKNMRSFERGDYVFKENGDCPKCNQKMTVTAIYTEEAEPEK